MPQSAIEFIEADIRDIEVMEGILKGADIVFHLACLGVRHSIHSPEENHSVNATATLQLLGAARRLGVGRFVYVSSSEVYGTAKYAPMDEQHPTWPETIYGAAKLAGERYTDAYWRTYRFPTTVVRPFNAFGPRCHHEGDSGEVIPKFILRSLAGQPLIVHGDGTQTRDFTYVSDTARGILAAGLSSATIGETVNLGQGQEISIIALARAVAEATGQAKLDVQHGEPRPGDVLRLCANVSKAQQLIDFAPTVSLRTGLELLTRWYISRTESPAELLQAEVANNWLR
jgi:UDP-glucose 4-epimerase